ncbi:glycosyltransferase family 4 protein [Anabaena lutea]|uniref:Glycosyltransferase family 4 protein n=1 Tax=Anabaena lutea FACHB-196 TaxID=2692881 RepID=A0ABR8FCL5_9NOST|nr:glycosyltransferase family 4 protein [Anabaena lutea]MBD2567396.1 glycosyltransferase family 4 protein [Anabaena lutea FACHB-196]
MKISLLHFCFNEYTIELANGLANYVDLTLIHPQELSAKSQNLLDPRIRVLNFQKPRIRDVRNLLAMGEMMEIIHQSQPDILHVQETNDPWYDLTLFLNKMPPLVTTIHDVFRHPGDRGSIPGSEYTRRIAFYRSQQIIIHAENLRDAMITHFKIPAQKLNVLPHGELGSLYKRLAKTKDVVKEPYTLLFIGRIWPYKGLKYLLEAMPLVAASIPEVKLIIAGRGENLDRYFPQGYDDQRYEILNRYIEREEMLSLFQRSKISILPYIEASQSGVAALSYGMGIPVIASDVGGLSEIVQHKKDGLLVPPSDVKALADGIINLLKDNQLYSQMQTATVRRCQEDLNWANIANKTVDVYRKILK